VEPSANSTFASVAPTTAVIAALVSANLLVLANTTVPSASVTYLNQARSRWLPLEQAVMAKYWPGISVQVKLAEVSVVLTVPPWPGDFLYACGGALPGVGDSDAEANGDVEAEG
jgi:hypothetical protein